MNKYEIAKSLLRQIPQGNKIVYYNTYKTCRTLKIYIFTFSSSPAKRALYSSILEQVEKLGMRVSEGSRGGIIVTFAKARVN